MSVRGQDCLTADSFLPPIGMIRLQPLSCSISSSRRITIANQEFCRQFDRRILLRHQAGLPYCQTISACGYNIWMQRTKMLQPGAPAHIAAESTSA